MEAEKALRLDSNYARAHQRRGNALEMVGRLNEAMQSYQKGASIDPNDAALKSAIEKLQQHIDSQAANAPKAAAKAAELTEAAKLKEEGNKLFKDKKFKQAVDVYTKAIFVAEGTGFEDLHILYSNRSLCQLKQDNIDEALSDANRCVELKPGWATGYSRRGDALQKSGDHEAAREAYLAGLKLNPMNANLKAAVSAEDAVLGLSGTPRAGEAVADADEETDLYAILGLEREATEDEISKGYRLMARKWHPDKNPGDVMAQAMTRKVNQAHDILTNPVKKRAYDKYGMEGLQILDQIGEEGYVKMERMEPYMPCLICCICLVSIPTLCFCCCCCCCCCGALKKSGDDGEYDEAGEFDDADEDGETNKASTEAPGRVPDV